MALDFLASNQQQQQQVATYQDKRFNRTVQMLKIAPDTTSLKLDFLPVSETHTHGIMREHRLNGSTVVCPTTVGKECPLCAAIRNNHSDNWYWETFKAKDRALFNVIPLTKDGKVTVMSADHKVPVYLYEVSAPLKKAQGFWLLLTGAVNSADPEDAYKRKFCDWEDGSSVKLSFVKDSFSGNDFAKVSNMEFIHPRNNYKQDFKKWDSVLYKIPDIYTIPEPDELQQYLEMMVRQRNAAYTPQQYMTVPQSHGFHANPMQTNNAPAVGTSAWAAANSGNDEVW